MADTHYYPHSVAAPAGGMAVQCECSVCLRAHCVYTRMCCVVVWG